MKYILKPIKWFTYILLTLITIIVVTTIITIKLTEPSNNRIWVDDQKILAYAEFNPTYTNKVTVHNIRNFAYTSTSTYNIKYYDKTFDLDKIESVWYAVVPFSGIPGSAHTLLSFQFKDNNYIAISVEARKETNESYDPIDGLFNNYEIMYVISDERDVIKLRSNFRKDEVYLYPIRTTPDKARELFVSMLEEANSLKNEPRFYNTIVNACTSNIAKHINKVTPHLVPVLSKEIIFPASSDKFAYDLGLLDTNLPFEEARKRYHINARALKYADAEDFSVKIRGEE